jgi:choline dehydrogenase-like flavoprotein
VGKHLKDHVQVPLFFHSSASGVRMSEVGISLGPDALRQPAGTLPGNPAEDANLPPELKALRDEAERRITEWATSGRGLISSSLYDAGAWFSTGLGDLHSHDAQIACIPCGCSGDLWALVRVDTAQFFDDVTSRLAPDASNILLLANPVLPHSEGEILLESADPAIPPAIRMNYYGDPHDMKVMVDVLRRLFDVAAHWPSGRLGTWLAPPQLATQHGYCEGTPPSDAFLEDLALHFSLTVYHLTSTCRICSVVDPQLRVAGVANLRVADASIMPNVVSGNTNATSIMIGEKAAEMVAEDHGLQLKEFAVSYGKATTQHSR